MPCDESVKAETPKDAAQIALAEFRYWNKAQTDSDTALFAMGAVAASANILCAIYGFRAPWHPKDNHKGKTQCKNKSKTTSSQAEPD